ncbi:MAG: PAS domain S-box protein [Clostridia bacterium]|nr:MAG: PAS domain S-box protein [Clostridia bacterium]
MKGLLSLLHNWHSWIIVVLLFICILLYYPEQFPVVKVSPFLGFRSHSIERILFLFLIALSGAVFRLRGGIVCLGTALAVMLLKALWLSPYRVEVLSETFTVAAIGILANWWLESRRRETGRREQALLKLDILRRELHSYIKIITENEKRLSILHSITKTINESFTLEEILSAVAGKIKEAVGIDGVLIFLLDEQERKLQLKVYHGVSEEFAHQVDGLKVGEGFNGWVAETGKPCLIEDSTADRRLSREVVKREGIGSQFIVPLNSQNKVVGTLCAAARGVRYFTSEERDLLTLIGAELGVAVQKAAFYDESEKARASLRELFEKAHDAIWVHDFEGRILTANRATSELIGYELDELIGEKVSRFLTPQGVELAKEVRQKLLSGDEIEQPYEQVFLRKDGAVAIVTMTTSLLTEQGKPIAFQNIARDVTRERQLQEDLRLYVRQITQAHEEERKRIARELHDDSIQSLIALSRQIEGIISNNVELPEAQTCLEGIQEKIDKIIAGMRRFIRDLRPPTLEFLGLLPALRELSSQLKEEACIDSEVCVSGVERHLAPEDELLIYRVVQEAIRNVWKHSGATKSRVAIEFSTDKITVTVNDNGKGFTFNETSDFIRSGKTGLAGMQERANLLRGKLSICSRPGSGTRVVLEVPSD